MVKRILIIEDEDSVRAVLVDALHDAGYDVLEASNGKEGINLYREAPTDLIITDLIMPEKEGLGTIMELRCDSPHVKIIAMSGGGMSSGNDYLRIAQKLGAKRTLSKPFDLEDFLHTVREVIEQP
jgi:CheY-like chemotaxis protein